MYHNTRPIERNIVDKEIVIFKTPTCVKCPRLMAQLDAHNVPYRVVDLSENEVEMHRISVELGIKEVPVTEYGDLRLKGYFYGEVMDLIKRYKTEHAR